MQQIIQKKSCGSAKIFWLDKDLLYSKINIVAAKISASCPEVNKIILFGSILNNKALASSDIDILIIVNDTKDRFIDRPVRYMDFFKGIGMATDIFVYTEEETTMGIPIIDTVLETGRILYQR